MMNVNKQAARNAACQVAKIITQWGVEICGTQKVVPDAGAIYSSMRKWGLDSPNAFSVVGRGRS